mmetsp:Transcript_14896/g.42769  ORF Transcript_14896/g.42769 Transcript_14896/m.42769 type:complete len:90 (+) Transcript_14896:1257-1526(+)
MCRRAPLRKQVLELIAVQLIKKMRHVGVVSRCLWATCNYSIDVFNRVKQQLMKDSPGKRDTWSCECLPCKLCWTLKTAGQTNCIWEGMP